MPPEDPSFATGLIGEKCLICWEQFEAGKMVVYYDVCTMIHPLHYDCHMEWYFKRKGKNKTCCLCNRKWSTFHTVTLRAQGSELAASSSSSSSAPSESCDVCGFPLLPGYYAHQDTEELGEDGNYRLSQTKVCLSCCDEKSETGAGERRGDGDDIASLLR